MKRSTLGVRRSGSKSHDAEVRFGDLAEASFSTPSVEYVFYLLILSKSFD